MIDSQKSPHIIRNGRLTLGDGAREAFGVEGRRSSVVKRQKVCVRASSWERLSVCARRVSSESAGKRLRECFREEGEGVFESA
jgi:hypothetical protein